LTVSGLCPYSRLTERGATGSHCYYTPAILLLSRRSTPIFCHITTKELRKYKRRLLFLNSVRRQRIAYAQWAMRATARHVAPSLALPAPAHDTYSAAASSSRAPLSDILHCQTIHRLSLRPTTLVRIYPSPACFVTVSKRQPLVHFPVVIAANLILASAPSAHRYILKNTPPSWQSQADQPTKRKQHSRTY
jgi:hypothetical protein